MAPLLELKKHLKHGGPDDRSEFVLKNSYIGNDD